METNDFRFDYQTARSTSVNTFSRNPLLLSVASHLLSFALLDSIIFDVGDHANNVIKR